MPKVTYKCIDCGKESGLKYPYQFERPKEEYRCYECAMKLRYKKVTYKCIDCGKEKTAAPSTFSKPEKEYRCSKCAAIFRAHNNTIWLNKVSESNKNKVKTTEWKIKHREGIDKRSKDPEWIRNNKIAMKEISTRPEIREFQKNKMIKLWQDENYLESQIDKFIQSRNNPLVLENIKAAAIDRSLNNLNWIENNLIHLTGEGFWYGNKSLIKWNYGTKEYYCELWNRNLWDRIDAAYDYRSIISGKDKFDNGGIMLHRHHLYWQKKACCKWDEDNGGYYAWINNCGVLVKYYIKGDPNKFVLLTTSEHAIIRGKKGSDKDRIYWIQYLENLIEEREKEGKKCYLSKEEYEVYKVEHADIIEKYTNRKVYK